MFPPFAGITYYRVRAHLPPLIVMSCIVMLILHCIYCFFPFFSPVDYETDAAAAQFDYRIDDPLLLARATRQAPP